MIRISFTFSIHAALALSMSLAAAAALAQNAPTGYAALDQYQLPTGQGTPRFAAPSGASLRETLNRWAALAGYKPVVWHLPEDTDFTLGEARRFDGNFEQAAKMLVQALGAEANLMVNTNPTTRVVVVESRQ